MNRLSTMIPMLSLALAGCVMGGMPADGRHLTPMQCDDLTAQRRGAPASMRQNQSELAALEAAGYNPSAWFDPYYPDDLQAAQQLVDYWYRNECPQAMTTGAASQPAR
jgi:hypothetical protein